MSNSDTTSSCPSTSTESSTKEKTDETRPKKMKVGIQFMLFEMLILRSKKKKCMTNSF